MHPADLARVFPDEGALGATLDARFAGARKASKVLDVVHELAHWRVRGCAWSALRDVDTWDGLNQHVSAELEAVEVLYSFSARGVARCAEDRGRWLLLREEVRALAVEDLLGDLLALPFYVDAHVFSVAAAFEDLEGVDSMQVNALVTAAKGLKLVQRATHSIAVQCARWDKVYG